MILLRRPWTAQPQQPVAAKANGLVHAWALNVGGPRKILDMAGIATGEFGVGVGGTSGNAWVANPFAQSILFNNAGTDSVTSTTIKLGNAVGSGSPGSQRFSLQMRIRLSAISAHQTLYSGSTGGIQFRVNGGTGTLTLNEDFTAHVGTSTGAISANVAVDVGCSYDGSTVRFYINGAFAGSNVSSNTFVLNKQHAIGDHGDLDGTLGELILNGAVVYYLHVWNRPLSAGEFRVIANNPWSVFQPRQIIIPTASAAIVPPTLLTAYADQITATSARPNVTFTRP